ncbi:NADPH-dependent F420 reductase [Tumidithrix elongata RA019]|uniref:NADPH-dependent F420 reductase n=1 Tax=Tumidithrix elongata BACA0141 TaxID=2716417 RepID=A0AAW9Q2I1_9CYAN|nr:NADPH-dependent F420 reductase [Tumidithrix elongata RA019]
MKIGILGAGNVGGTLGERWAKQGHQILFGVRNRTAIDLQVRLDRTGGNAQAGSMTEAAEFGEVVVLTVPWGAVEELLPSLGNLEGKILLDCTNPNFTGEPSQYHPISGGERVAELVPTAKVVKIFNTTGWENMADPQYGSEAITMFYAGDDDAAKAVAATLAAELGFDPVDAGSLSNSGLLEAIAQLWGKLAYAQKLGRGIAFKLLKRP